MDNFKPQYRTKLSIKEDKGMGKKGKTTGISGRAHVNGTDTFISVTENLDTLHNEYYNVVTNNVIAVLCTKGSASIYLNGRELNVKANDILICQPHTVVERYETSDDFKGFCSMLSKEYVYRISMISGGNWDMKVFLENNPILTLSDNEVETFSLYFRLIRKKLADTHGNHQKELLDSLLGSFVFELNDIIERFIVLAPPTFSSAENIFREFMRLLSSSFPKKRDVSFYADALNVTPKYLSAVCKSVCGHTAFDLISRYVVRDVAFMLKKREMSIKEIVNELDFPNISFFGKYVKKHLGVPPRKYREILFRKSSDGNIDEDKDA